jgi:3-deoxy-D-manno-octulosonic-acid transferase
MAVFIYNFLLRSYDLLVWLAAFRNDKARKFLEGRKNIFARIENKIQNNAQSRVWFHCASLGEFEQARPVIEKFREQHPDFFIILTFFSPSGYEVRKDYNGADAIFYLPVDSRKNALKFLEITQPKIVYFTKYDFWYFYLSEIKKRQIPVVLFSALFRENQLFFKSYGGLYRKMLACFTHIFVQNQFSADLLSKIGITQVTVAGDTRFDRVKQTVEQRKEIPLAATFKNGKKLIVIGSSWTEDMEVLIPFINKFTLPLKIIIAPHEIKEQYLNNIETHLQCKTIRFSAANLENILDKNVLLIDNVGMLASLYAYGDFAFVGGAFKQGLHNILEPATFGMPVFFGPNIEKYPEAAALVALKGAFAIQDEATFTNLFTSLYQNENDRLACAKITQKYILSNTGATDKILNVGLKPQELIPS